MDRKYRQTGKVVRAVVTAKGITKEAGTSYSTVSRALSNIRTESTENKERILELAREMRYVSSQAAINLKLFRSYTIGFYFSIVSKVSSPFVLYNILTGVYSVVGSKYNVVVKGTDMYEKGTLNPGFYDGIIVPSQRTEDGEFIEEAMAKNIPIVAICRAVSYGVPNMVADGARAMETAMDYLLEHGRQKIGVIEGNPNLDSTRLGERRRRSSMLKHGLDPNDLPVETGNHRYASGYQATKKLVEEHQGLTAILCFNDEMVFAARAAIYEAKLTMPDDTPLVGFDNWDMSGYGSMRLTTVERSMSEITKEGTGALLRWLEDDIIDNGRIYLDDKLIIRETVKDIR